MKPYFDTSHVTSGLLAVAVLVWGVMELGHRAQGYRNRAGARRIGQPGYRIALLLGLIAAGVVLFLAPRAVPAAAVRPPAAVFAAGLVVLVGGLVLRGWSFLTLGRYFTHTVMVSSDQPVISTGPYRLLRHPSYAGLVLALAGIGSVPGALGFAEVGVHESIMSDECGGAIGVRTCG